MTFNSKDEREVFKNYLGDSFDFVELVSLKDKKWLENACKIKIQCDVLLISGHFGGTFFGELGKISLETLENRACQKTCHGIFEAPKEVFLFGCNTMAGKELDSRTMEEYARALYNEHRETYRTRLMAEEAAAYRYSPLGAETQDRMRRVFKNSRIYGFHSLAPSGRNIRPRLKDYFQSIPQGDYKAHLKNFPMEKENTFWSQAMKGQYIRSANGFKDSENSICTLLGSQPIYKKLSWIDKIFTDQNVLTYAPNINEYLSSLEQRLGSDWEDWPKEEVSYMEYLQFHKRAKSKVGSFLQHPIKGLLTVQFKLSSLGLKLGWYDESEEKEIQRRLLGDLFLKNLTLEEKDQVCSLGGVRIDLGLEDLPSKKWSSTTIRALGCIRPFRESVHKVLVQALTDPDTSIRRNAAWALGQIKPSNEDIHRALAQALVDTEKSVRNNAAWALGQVETSNENIHRTLAQLLIIDPEWSVRNNVAWALGQIKPSDENIHKALNQALKDSHWYVRGHAALALGKIKHLNKESHMALAQALADSKENVRNQVMWALEQIQPQSQDVLNIISSHDFDFYQKLISK